MMLMHADPARTGYTHVAPHPPSRTGDTHVAPHPPSPSPATYLMIILLTALAALTATGCASTPPRPPADPAATHYEATVPGLPIPGGAIGGMYRAVDTAAVAPPVRAGQELQRFGLRLLRWGGLVAAIALAAHIMIRSAGPVSILLGHICEWAFAAAAGLSGVGLIFIGLGRYLWVILPLTTAAAIAMWYFRRRGVCPSATTTPPPTGGTI